MWDGADADAARRKGWVLDEVAGCVRAVPGGPHVSDARAQAVVARLAIDRNALARKAWLHLAALTEPACTPGGHGLCMVEDMPDGYRVAYFTRLPLDLQWGDGWGMGRPRDNAGPPYGFDGAGGPAADVLALRFSAPLLSPWDMPTTPATLSVADINRGAAPWLAPDPRGPVADAPPVGAGIGVQAFRDLLGGLGGWVEPYPHRRR